MLADLLGAPRSTAICPAPGDTPSPKAKGTAEKPDASEQPKGAPVSPTPGKPAGPDAKVGG